MKPPTPFHIADICKRCGHYSRMIISSDIGIYDSHSESYNIMGTSHSTSSHRFTCKHNGNSVEYEGEENEDCSLYIPRKK